VSFRSLLVALIPSPATPPPTPPPPTHTVVPFSPIVRYLFTRAHCLKSFGSTRPTRPADHGRFGSSVSLNFFFGRAKAFTISRGGTEAQVQQMRPSCEAISPCLFEKTDLRPFTARGRHVTLRGPGSPRQQYPSFEICNHHGISAKPPQNLRFIRRRFHLSLSPVADRQKLHLPNKMECSCGTFWRFRGLLGGFVVVRPKSFNGHAGLMRNRIVGSSLFQFPPLQPKSLYPLGTSR